MSASPSTPQAASTQPVRKIVPRITSATSAETISAYRKSFSRDNDVAEDELYRHGIPYRLERVNGRLVLEPSSIRVTFPDNQQRLGGFEIDRCLYVTTIKLISQALEYLCCNKLDWRAFPKRISFASIDADGFILTSLFTDDHGELVRQQYFCLRAHSCAG